MAETPDFHINFFSLSQCLDRFRDFYFVEIPTVKIIDLTTFRANEMMMGLRVSVKMNTFS